MLVTPNVSSSADNVNQYSTVTLSEEEPWFMSIDPDSITQYFQIPEDMRKLYENGKDEYLEQHPYGDEESFQRYSVIQYKSYLTFVQLEYRSMQSE